MGELRTLDGRIKGRWGASSVLLELSDGVEFRAPLPDPMFQVVTPGRHVAVSVDETGGFIGWSVPDEKVGARTRVDPAFDREADTLVCQGSCQTLWHLVSGGRGWAEDACLTCGGVVIGPHQGTAGA